MWARERQTEIMLSGGPHLTCLATAKACQAQHKAGEDILLPWQRQTL